MTNTQGKADTSRSRSTLPLHSLGQHATALLNAVAKGVDRKIGSHGITPMDFAAIRLFLVDKEWTATELAQVLPVEVPAISRMVSKLVDRGLLFRRRQSTDRRVVILKLTEEGQRLGLELHQSVHSYEEKLTEGINEGDMDTFRSVIQVILSNATDLEQS